MCRDSFVHLQVYSNTSQQQFILLANSLYCHIDLVIDDITHLMTGGKGLAAGGQVRLEVDNEVK